MDVCFDKRKNDRICRKNPADTILLYILKQCKSLIIFVIDGSEANKFPRQRSHRKIRFHLILLSDMLRFEVNSASETGHRFEEITRAESPQVPTNVTAQLVEEKMMTQPNASGYLVVGFPRHRRQVISAISYLKKALQTRVKGARETPKYTRQSAISSDSDYSKRIRINKKR